MDTVIAAPASCEVRAVIRFLHAEGQSGAEIHRRLCRVYGANVNIVTIYMTQSTTNLGRALSFCVKKTNHSTYLTAGGSGDECPCFISIYSYTKWRKCMRVGVQQEQKFLVTTERAL